MSRLRHHNHKLTTTGYYVCGVKRSEHTWRDKQTGELKTTKYISGRIIENEKGEWLQPAQWAKWDRNGVAMNHEYGDIHITTIEQ